MLTPAKVAAQLDISPQTLRRWSEAFAGALSIDACPDPGRTRRYSSNDLAILRHAKALFDAGRTAAEVGTILPTVQLAGEEAPSMPSSTDAPEVALTIPMSAGERFMQTMSDQKTAIDRLIAHDDAQAAQLAALAGLVVTLTAQLAAIQAGQAPERRRRPAWLRRLMGDSGR